MSVKAAATMRQFFGGNVSIYFEADRVEIGTSNALCQEELKRVAYRDVRRVVSWSEPNRVASYAGLAALVLAGVLGALAALIGAPGSDDRTVLVFVIGFVAVCSLCMSVVLLWSGRPRGITRLRIEGVHGHIDAVLSGRLQKREKVLAELARRIRERQTIG